MKACAWWLEAARAVDILVPDGLVGLNGEDWSISRRVHCLDYMRRVLDGPDVMRLEVIPCGRCSRCFIEQAHQTSLGPRAAAFVTLQAVVWFPDPDRGTPPGWRSARIAADTFVVLVQRARLDLALSLARPHEQLDRRELLRRVALLRVRQESAWSSAALHATRALRWVAAREVGAAEYLEVAWRGFLASRIQDGGVMYETPLHVRDAISRWRAN